MVHFYKKNIKKKVKKELQNKHKLYIIHNKRGHTNEINKKGGNILSMSGGFFRIVSSIRCSSYLITDHQAQYYESSAKQVSSLKTVFFSDAFFGGKIYHEHQKGMFRQKADRKRVRKIENKKQEQYSRAGGRGQEVKKTELYRELTAYQEAGISLWLNGKPSNSYRIASSVREKNDYMRDYYMNHKNEICGIGFDRIRIENEKETVPLCRKLN